MTNSDRRLSYSPKFAWIPENIRLLLVLFSSNPSLQFSMTILGKFGPQDMAWHVSISDALCNNFSVYNLKLKLMLSEDKPKPLIPKSLTQNYFSL